uniref:Uncharacterized protein n=1 Tax=Spermophilus dauricus TaxID=99837 RepID=A0A8C9QAR3_SPEDA
MGRVMVVRLRLGLMLLALLLSMQIYSNQTAVVISSNSSQCTSAASNSTNATPKADRWQCPAVNSQSPCDLTLSSTSLQLETQVKKRLCFPIF